MNTPPFPWPFFPPGYAPVTQRHGDGATRGLAGSEVTKYWCEKSSHLSLPAKGPIQ